MKRNESQHHNYYLTSIATTNFDKFRTSALSLVRCRWKENSIFFSSFRCCCFFRFIDGYNFFFEVERFFCMCGASTFGRILDSKWSNIPRKLESVQKFTNDLKEILWLTDSQIFHIPIEQNVAIWCGLDFSSFHLYSVRFSSSLHLSTIQFIFFLDDFSNDISAEVCVCERVRERPSCCRFILRLTYFPSSFGFCFAGEWNNQFPCKENSFPIFFFEIRYFFGSIQTMRLDRFRAHFLFNSAFSLSHSSFRWSWITSE